MFLIDNNGEFTEYERCHIQLFILYFLVRNYFEPLPQMVQEYLKILSLYCENNSNDNNLWSRLHKLYKTLFTNNFSIAKLKDRNFRINKVRYRVTGITDVSNRAWKLKYCDVKKQFYLKVEGSIERVEINNKRDLWGYLKKIGINSFYALKSSLNVSFTFVGDSLPSLYKRFTVTGILIGNNRTFEKIALKKVNYFICHLLNIC